MNVLLTTSSLLKISGGPSSSVARTSDGLIDLYNNVDILSQKFNDKFGENILPIRSEVNVLLAKAWFSQKFRITISLELNKIFSKLAVNNYDIVHDNGLWMQSNYLSFRFALKNNLPFILSPRGMLMPWAMDFKSKKKQFLWKLFQKNICKNVSGFVATSQEEAESIQSYNFNKPIEIIANPIVIPLKKELISSNVNKRTALFLSRIHPVKGVLTLINAWNEIRPAGWILKIAGPDEDNHLKDVVSLIEKLKVQNSIQIVGPVYGNAKDDLFKNSELFILPSYTENFGVVIAEALSQSVPVITTKGTPWSVLPKIAAGWWINNDVSSLSLILDTATKKSSLELFEMGSRGRTYVENHFSQDCIAKKLSFFYSKVKKDL